MIHILYDTVFLKLILYLYLNTLRVFLRYLTHTYQDKSVFFFSLLHMFKKNAVIIILRFV